MSKPRLLWVGDAVQQTGFARVTHNVLAHLHEKWDVHVLGINYLGDPHPYPYKIYPAVLGGDVFGVQRFGTLVRALSPDVVCILQDPWQVTRYLNTDAPPQTPIMAYMPVDGKNLPSAAGLTGLEAAIWYTRFGQTEGERGGFTGRSEIIPHGVDTTIYSPGDREEARAKLGLSAVLPKDAFIVGNINRNQPRKRLDLTLQYFASWWQGVGKPSNAFLYLHCSRYDIGYDVVQLARYFGIARHMIMSKVKLTPSESVSEENLVLMYRALNAAMSTTMGEGWGLTTMEGMACGIPHAVPEWSALGEWPRGSVIYVPCDTFAVTPKGVNVLGGIPSGDRMVAALDRLYRDREWREEYGRRALACATRPEFQWSNIAQEFDRVFNSVIRQSGAGVSREQAGYVDEQQTPTPDSAIAGPGDEQAGHVHKQEAVTG